MASPLCHSAEVSPSYRLDAWRELSTVSLFLKMCFLQFQDHLQCSHGCLRKGRSMAAITRHVPGHIPILRIFPPVLCQPTACCAAGHASPRTSTKLQSCNQFCCDQEAPMRFIALSFGTVRCVLPRLCHECLPQRPRSATKQTMCETNCPPAKA